MEIIWQTGWLEMGLMAVRMNLAAWKIMVGRMGLAVEAWRVDRKCFLVGQFAYSLYYSRRRRRVMVFGAGQRCQVQRVGQRQEQGMRVCQRSRKAD